MMQMDTTSSRTPSQSRKDELRASLYSLAEACPVAECNLEDCPLFKVRKMKHMERLMWFDALSEQDLINLNTYHHICLNTKLAAKTVE
jgi:hypothetical protein